MSEAPKRNICLIRSIACTGALLIGLAAAATDATIKRKRTITAADLARLVDLEGLAITPDGRFAAFQMRRPDPDANAYAMAWYVTPTHGGPTRRIADAGDPILAGGYVIVGPVVAPQPVWSPDSQWIAFLRKDKGGTQVWRARIDGQRVEQLTHGEDDVRSLAFAADGKKVLFERQPSTAQIEKALAQEGRSGFRFDRRFGPSYSRMPLLPRDLPQDTESRMKGTSESLQARRTVGVFDLQDRRERTATEEEGRAFEALTALPKANLRYGQSAAVSPSGAVAWTEARDPAAQGLYAPLTLVAQRTPAAEPIVCAAAECTGQAIRGVWWRNDYEVLYVRGEGVVFQDQALYSWRTAEARPRLVLRTADLFVSSGDWECAVAQERLVCFYEEPSRPRRLVAIDLQTAAIHTLYDPNPNFSTLELGPTPRRVHFNSSLAGENFGYLVLPPRAHRGTRLPLTVVTYRCRGFLRGGTGDEYPIFALAAQGHAVLCFNLPDLDFARLATMQAEAYEAWVRGVGDRERRRIQESLEAAISQLDASGFIDPRRVGITGLSAGGETVMYALFHMPRLAAAIASGTEFGPASGFLYGPAGREQLRRWGLHDWASPRWDALSITRNAERVRAPLLLNVADREMIDALHPYTALEEAGRAVELYVYPDEYHQKYQPAHRLAIYERNIAWLDFWLRGVEDIDSTRQEWYERWRAMRIRQCELFKDNDAPWYCGP